MIVCVHLQFGRETVVGFRDDDVTGRLRRARDVMRDVIRRRDAGVAP